MAKITPIEFVRQVRQEISKVTWPTRKETVITSGMVFLMVTLMAIFFFLADQVLALGVRARTRKTCSGSPWNGSTSARAESSGNRSPRPRARGSVYLF